MLQPKGGEVAKDCAAIHHRRLQREEGTGGGRRIEHAKALKSEDSGLPFKSIVSCNIGNPQECGQKPLTFPRQVMSLIDYPDLLESPLARDVFPDDVVETSDFMTLS